MVVSLEVSIENGRDDAYHNPEGWPNYNDRNKIVLSGSPGNSSPVYGGWRWSGPNIPPGAVIEEAFVELTQSEWGNVFETTLSFEDSGAPLTFTSGSTPYNRWVEGHTTFETDWRWDKGAPGDKVRTPSLL